MNSIHFYKFVKKFSFIMLIFALGLTACEKDEIFDLNNQLQAETMERERADARLAQGINDVQMRLDNFKAAQAVLDAGQDAVIAANDAASIARDAKEEAARAAGDDVLNAELIAVHDELSITIAALADEVTAQVARIDSTALANFTVLTEALVAEADARTEGDDALAAALQLEIDARKIQAQSLLNSIVANAEAIEAVAADLEDEVAILVAENAAIRLEFAAADAAQLIVLQDQIISNDLDILAAQGRLVTLEAEAVTLQNNIDAEVAKLEAADSALALSISTDSTDAAAALQAAVNALNASIAANKLLIEANDADIAANIADIAALKTQIETGISSLTMDIQAVETMVKAIEPFDPAAIQSSIQSLTLQLDALQLKVDGLPADDDSGLQDQIDELDTQIKALIALAEEGGLDVTFEFDVTLGSNAELEAKFSIGENVGFDSASAEGVKLDTSGTIGSSVDVYIYLKPTAVNVWKSNATGPLVLAEFNGNNSIFSDAVINNEEISGDDITIITATVVVIDDQPSFSVSLGNLYVELDCTPVSITEGAFTDWTPAYVAGDFLEDFTQNRSMTTTTVYPDGCGEDLVETSTQTRTIEIVITSNNVNSDEFTQNIDANDDGDFQDGISQTTTTTTASSNDPDFTEVVTVSEPGEWFVNQNNAPVEYIVVESDLAELTWTESGTIKIEPKDGYEWNPEKGPSAGGINLTSIKNGGNQLISGDQTINGDIVYVKISDDLNLFGYDSITAAVNPSYFQMIAVPADLALTFKASNVAVAKIAATNVGFDAAADSYSVSSTVGDTEEFFIFVKPAVGLQWGDTTPNAILVSLSAAINPGLDLGLVGEYPDLDGTQEAVALRVEKEVKPNQEAVEIDIDSNQIIAIPEDVAYTFNPIFMHYGAAAADKYTVSGVPEGNVWVTGTEYTIVLTAVDDYTFNLGTADNCKVCTDGGDTITDEVASLSFTIDEAVGEEQAEVIISVDMDTDLFNETDVTQVVDTHFTYAAGPLANATITIDSEGTYTITPDEGYAIAFPFTGKWKVVDQDGKAIGSGGAKDGDNLVIIPAQRPAGVLNVNLTADADIIVDAAPVVDLQDVIFFAPSYENDATDQVIFSVDGVSQAVNTTIEDAFDANQTFTFTVTAKTGFSFVDNPTTDHFNVTNITGGNIGTWTVAEDNGVITVTVTITSGYNWSLNDNERLRIAALDTLVVADAVAIPTFTFSSDGKFTVGPQVITSDGDYSYTVTIPDTHKFNENHANIHQVSPNTPNNVSGGDQTAVIVFPKETAAGNYTITMLDSGVSIIKANVNWNAPANAQFQSQPPTQLEVGTQVTVAVSAEEGKLFVDNASLKRVFNGVTSLGNPVGFNFNAVDGHFGSFTYTFTPGTININNVIVSFQVDTVDEPVADPMVTLDFGTDSSMNLPGVTTVIADEDYTFEITPASGYVIAPGNVDNSFGGSLFIQLSGIGVVNIPYEIIEKNSGDGYDVTIKLSETPGNVDLDGGTLNFSTAANLVEVDADIAIKAELNNILNSISFTEQQLSGGNRRIFIHAGSSFDLSGVSASIANFYQANGDTGVDIGVLNNKTYFTAKTHPGFAEPSPDATAGLDLNSPGSNWITTVTVTKDGVSSSKGFTLNTVGLDGDIPAGTQYVDFN